MKSFKNKSLLVVLAAVVVVFAMASLAYAAPLIPKGYGWVDGPHGSYPGYCLNCHSGFSAGAAPAINAGATPPHHDRGSTCTQCHTINTPPPPPARVPVTYVKGAAGTGRYDTSIEVSKKTFASTAPAVVLATGADFPDALCAAPLAKAFGGPILLVAPGGTMSSPLTAEITRLHPSQIFIVGSASVVSAGVESAAKALSWAPTVTRLAGGNRYETAALVAATLKTKLGSISKIVVANGRNYPDALSVAPLAAAKGWPILLTEATSLPSFTASAVAGSAATSTLIVGGPSVVGTNLESQLPAPLRKAGAGRYETCALVAQYAVSLGMTWDPLVTTVGNNYPDALAAGPMVATKNGCLLLVPPTGAVPASISSIMSAHKMAVTSMIVVGGALPAAQVSSMSTILN
jgi:putative cell wall-binding protein